MKHYYGVIEFRILHSPYELDIFFYDTLDTVYQNAPPQLHGDGVPPMAVQSHHLFTSLRGVTLGMPGDSLHKKEGGTLTLFKHVILVDRYFFMDLSHHEFDALVTREEILFQHIHTENGDHALHNPAEYVITHDTLTCHRGVHAPVLKRALRKAKHFECSTIARIFKMDRFDRFLLRLMYHLQGFNLHNRIRNKNLKRLKQHTHNKPLANSSHLSRRRSL